MAKGQNLFGGREGESTVYTKIALLFTLTLVLSHKHTNIKKGRRQERDASGIRGNN